MELVALSEELLLELFRLLDLRSLCHVASTCSTLWRVAADDCLWRPFWAALPFGPCWREESFGAQAPDASKGHEEARPLRLRFVACARASRLLLQRHTDASSPDCLRLRAMIVGAPDVGKHSLADALHRVFGSALCDHICSKEHYHTHGRNPPPDWNEPPEWADDRELVTPWRAFGETSVRVTTEVAQLAPANAPPAYASEQQSEDHGDSDKPPLDLNQMLQIVRMPGCAGVRPDVVLVVASVTSAASILAVYRQIVPAIRREYNHLPILLVTTHTDHRSDTISLFTQVMTLSERVGAADFVETSPYLLDGLGAALRATIRLGIRSAMTQALQHDKLDEDVFLRDCAAVTGLRTRGVFDVIPFIHYDIGCSRCAAKPIVGQVWTCKSCGEPEPMCSACKRDHARRKAEHRLVPYSADQQRRRRRRGASERTTAVDQPDLQLARTGFSHRNSLYFAASNKRHKLQEDQEQEQEQGMEEEEESIVERKKTERRSVVVPARWRAGVDDIFQLFSKKK